MSEPCALNMSEHGDGVNTRGGGGGDAAAAARWKV